MMDFEIKNENLKDLDKNKQNMKDLRSRTKGKFVESKI